MVLIKRNKKIRNAKEVIEDGIKFKSIFERNAYLKFKEANLNAIYSNEKFKIFNEFILNNVNGFISSNKLKKTLLNMKVRGITYTPDFIIKTEKNYYVIEIKGFRNDVYPVKLKFILNYLENLNIEQKKFFFEAKNLTDVIEIIKTIQKNEENGNKEC